MATLIGAGGMGTRGCVVIRMEEGEGGGVLDNRQERNLQVGSSSSPRRELGKARLRDVVMVRRLL